MLQSFSEVDRRVVYECMNTILHSGYIESLELHPRLGLDPDELAEIVSAWPTVEAPEMREAAELAINNCLNEVLNGISFREGDWQRWIKFPRQDVERIFALWRARSE